MAKDIKFNMKNSPIPPIGLNRYHNPVNIVEVLNEMVSLKIDLIYAFGEYPSSLIVEGELKQGTQLLIPFDLLNILMQIDRITYNNWKRYRYGI